jgi:hypothetical protein
MNLMHKYVIKRLYTDSYLGEQKRSSNEIKVIETFCEYMFDFLYKYQMLDSKYLPSIKGLQKTDPQEILYQFGRIDHVYHFICLLFLDLGHDTSITMMKSKLGLSPETDIRYVFENYLEQLTWIHPHVKKLLLQKHRAIWNVRLDQSVWWTTDSAELVLDEDIQIKKSMKMLKLSANTAKVSEKAAFCATSKLYENNRYIVNEYARLTQTNTIFDLFSGDPNSSIVFDQSSKGSSIRVIGRAVQKINIGIATVADKGITQNDNPFMGFVDALHECISREAKEIIAIFKRYYVKDQVALTSLLELLKKYDIYKETSRPSANITENFKIFLGDYNFNDSTKFRSTFSYLEGKIERIVMSSEYFLKESDDKIVPMCHIKTWDKGNSTNNTTSWSNSERLRRNENIHFASSKLTNRIYSASNAKNPEATIQQGIFKTISDLNIYMYAVLIQSTSATGDTMAGCIHMYLSTLSYNDLAIFKKNRSVSHQLRQHTPLTLYPKYIFEVNRDKVIRGVFRNDQGTIYDCNYARESDPDTRRKSKKEILSERNKGLLSELNKRSGNFELPVNAIGGMPLNLKI